MNVLIVYGTYSGGTLQVAQEIERLLTEAKHTVTVKNIVKTASSGQYEFDADSVIEAIKSHDVIILGSCTWMEDDVEGQMHAGFKFLDKQLGEQSVNEKKFAVYGLGDSNYAQFCGAVSHLEKLVTSRRGNLIMPSMRIDKYYFDTQKAHAELNEWVKNLLKSV